MEKSFYHMTNLEARLFQTLTPSRPYVCSRAPGRVASFTSSIFVICVFKM